MKRSRFPKNLEWVYELPSHWRRVRLKFLAPAILSGSTPSTGKQEYWDGDIPWVSPKDMKVAVIYDTEDHVTESAIAETNLPIVEPGHVLMVVRSGILKHSIPVALNAVPVSINQDMKAIRCSDELLPVFLKYIVEGNQTALLERWRKLGCTVESLEHDYYGNDEIPLPPIEEQAEICRYLDCKTTRIDALIRKKRKLLELLEEKRLAVITQAVTRGLDPNLSMKDSGAEWLGEMPAHWEVKAIKFVARVGNGSTPKRDNSSYWNGTFPWLNSSVVNQREVSEGVEFVTELALEECHLPCIEPPAVLVGITGEGKTRGMATILNIKATINQHLAFLKPYSGTVDAAYLMRVMEKAYGYLRNESVGGGSTKGAITCEQLSKMAIPIPPLDEQHKIVEFIAENAEKIYALQEAIQRAITSLEEYRAALITNAVTGKIDVREFAADQSSAA